MFPGIAAANLEQQVEGRGGGGGVFGQNDVPHSWSSGFRAENKLMSRGLAATKNTVTA